MPFEIVQLLDEVPNLRAGRPRVDKYASYAELLGQIPDGKIARIDVPRSEYRGFSAAIRAAGFRGGKKVSARWKGGSAYVSWEILTEENRPKRRGRPRAAVASEQRHTSTLTSGNEEPLSHSRSFVEDEIDPTLVGDLDAEVSPDVAAFQEEARRRQRRRRG